ncbi:hypothetical protein HY479_03010 [Candidatus Uhrbacteria bacterium]|nr:hypothetical protein [Candidatus Uhrbacteria bacterium]
MNAQRAQRGIVMYRAEGNLLRPTVWQRDEGESEYASSDEAPHAVNLSFYVIVRSGARWEIGLLQATDVPELDAQLLEQAGFHGWVSIHTKDGASPLRCRKTLDDAGLKRLLLGYADMLSRIFNVKNADMHLRAARVLHGHPLTD